MKAQHLLVSEQQLLHCEIKSQDDSFCAHEVLHELKHYLPAQAPLKDFIHHNTLHAFQNLPFHRALQHASAIFDYKVSLSLSEYRSFYQSGRIREDILNKIILEKKGAELAKEWKEKLVSAEYTTERPSRIGSLRSYRKNITI